MMKRRILIFCGFYIPGYKAGGPIRSVANMVDILNNIFDIYIITSDRDFGDKIAFPSIKINEWNDVDNARVYYLSPDKMRLSVIRKLISITPHSIIYLNSYFDLIFSIYPLLAKRLLKTNKSQVILAPRGEFSEGALKLKNLKKHTYIYLAKFFGLYKNIVWHASSNFEKDDISNIIGNRAKEIIVAPNIPTKLSNESLYNAKSEGEKILKIVFISRISKKKNLHFALDILGKVKKTTIFNIYGIVDDNSYWDKCKEIINKLPKNIHVNYGGSIPHNKVMNTFALHDLFFMPTLGENYGHAIVESFLSGIPVLITDATPWRELEKDGVGWDISLSNPEKFIEVVNYYHDLVNNGRQIPKSQIIDWINVKLNYSEVIQSNLLLFNNDYR